jgi:hypothetical protein
MLPRKTILLLAVFAFSASGIAQDTDPVCGRNLATEFQKASEGNPRLAQSGLYSAYTRTLMEQLDKLTKGAGLLELMASTDLIFLDDELVRLQKQRLSLLSEFTVKNRDKLLSGRRCEVAADFPPVLSKATAIDAAYAARFEAIIRERLAELLKPTASVPQPVTAPNTDPDCGKTLEQQLNNTYVMGETDTVRSTFQRLAADCVDENRCVQIENLVVAQQLSLDDELLRLRKQRLQLFNGFAVRNRATFLRKDACAAEADFSSISGEIKALNDAYLVRARALRDERLAAIPQGPSRSACTKPSNPYANESEQDAGFKWAQSTKGEAACARNSASFNEGCTEYKRQQATFRQCKANE